MTGQCSPQGSGSDRQNERAGYGRAPQSGGSGRALPFGQPGPPGPQWCSKQPGQPEQQRTAGAAGSVRSPRPPRSSQLPRSPRFPQAAGTPGLRQGGQLPQLEVGYRLRWAKRGGARFLSHLDVLRALLRAIRRAQLPVALSQGYNPHLKIASAAALPLGVESEAEFVDVQLTRPMLPVELARRLAPALPPGFSLREVRYTPRGGRALAAYESVSRYVARPLPGPAPRSVGPAGYANGPVGSASAAGPVGPADPTSQADSGCPAGPTGDAWGQTGLSSPADLGGEVEADLADLADRVRVFLAQTAVVIERSPGRYVDVRSLVANVRCPATAGTSSAAASALSTTPGASSAAAGASSAAPGAPATPVGASSAVPEALAAPPPEAGPSPQAERVLERELVSAETVSRWAIEFDLLSGPRGAGRPDELLAALGQDPALWLVLKTDFWPLVEGVKLSPWQA